PVCQVIYPKPHFTSLNSASLRGTLSEGLLMFSSSDLSELVSAIRNCGDEERFVAACATMHSKATVDDVPQLRRLLEDDDALVREAAAWPISELVGPPALRDLLKAYQ